MPNQRVPLNASQVVQNLPTPSAQCGAFALLLESALAANGIHSNWIQVVATDGSLMVINNWGLGSTATYGGGIYRLTLNDPSYVLDYMVPAPTGGFGDLTNESGLAGQGMPTPAEKVFNPHLIVQPFGASGTLYYDPSYGVTYSSDAGFEGSAISGYATLDSPAANHTAFFRFRVGTGAGNITFTPVPGRSI